MITNYLTDAKHFWLYHTGICENILGPGKRLIVYSSGCPLSCPDCIERELQDLHRGKKWRTDDFISAISPILNSVDGITFSGGEPFYQAAALRHILRELSPQVQTLVFSGYDLDSLIAGFPDILNYIDILISGAYIKEQSGDFLWRGSENQEISSPNKSIPAPMLKKWMQSPSAGISMHLSDGNTFIYGIPAKGTLDALQHKLKNKQLELIC